MRTGWLASLTMAAALLIGASAAHSQISQIAVTVDENGHGTINGFLGLQPIASGLLNDPGPGGLSSVLTYSLLSPPSLTAGDVLIDEPGGSVLGDVVRFNPSESCFGSTGCLVFYSNPIGGFDSLADTASPPTAFYTNTVDVTEGLDGAVIYTPTSGEPGFVSGAAVPVTYDLISDSVPEPGSLAIFGSGLALLALRRRLRRAR